MLDKLIARTKNTFNRGKSDPLSPRFSVDFELLESLFVL